MPRHTVAAGQYYYSLKAEVDDGAIDRLRRYANKRDIDVTDDDMSIPIYVIGNRQDAKVVSNADIEPQHICAKFEVLSDA